MNAPTILTPRLTMRALHLDDDTAVHAIFGRGDVMANYVDLPYPATGWSLARVRRFIADDAASWAVHRCGRWALRSHDGTFVGVAGLSVESWLPVPAVPVGLSYYLHPDVWGQGLAREAATAALDYAFDDLGLLAVVGCVVPQNTRSVRVLTRLGLRRTATVPYTSAESGRDAEFAVYRVTAPEWAVHRAVTRVLA